VKDEIAGSKGIFLLQDACTIEGKIVKGDWFIMPGSSTGQLAELSSEGVFRANLGEAAHIQLDYWFE